MLSTFDASNNVGAQGSSRHHWLEERRNKRTTALASFSNFHNDHRCRNSQIRRSLGNTALTFTMPLSSQLRNESKKAHIFVSSKKRKNKKGGSTTKSWKKAPKCTYIPEAIKFKTTSRDRNKQNQVMNASSHNRDLLIHSMKPNRMNFMNKSSDVYELMLSGAHLPAFVQYFFGEALYTLQNTHKNEQYDWKMSEFKVICERIYQNSDESDLKHFMQLPLPKVNRWAHSQTSNNTITICNSREKTQTACSRWTLESNNRVNYFKSLNKKERESLEDCDQSADALNRLEAKLEKYLRTNAGKIVVSQLFE